MPHLKECLQKYFEGYGLIRELYVISNDEVHSDSEEQFIVTRYALMPTVGWSFICYNRCDCEEID